MKPLPAFRSPRNACPKQGEYLVLLPLIRCLFFIVYFLLWPLVDAKIGISSQRSKERCGFFYSFSSCLEFFPCYYSSPRLLVGRIIRLNPATNIYCDCQRILYSIANEYYIRSPTNTIFNRQRILYSITNADTCDHQRRYLRSPTQILAIL